MADNFVRGIYNGKKVKVLSTFFGSARIIYEDGGRGFVLFDEIKLLPRRRVKSLYGTKRRETP